MSTRIHRGNPLRRADAVLVDRSHDSVVTLPDAGTSLVLNPTARALWELCDGATRPEEMVRAICQVFAVDPVQASADVDAALHDLADVGLVAWSDVAPAPHVAPAPAGDGR